MIKLKETLFVTSIDSVEVESHIVNYYEAYSVVITCKGARHIVHHDINSESEAIDLMNKVLKIAKTPEL